MISPSKEQLSFIEYIRNDTISYVFSLALAFILTMVLATGMYAGLSARSFNARDLVNSPANTFILTAVSLQLIPKALEFIITQTIELSSDVYFHKCVVIGQTMSVYFMHLALQRLDTERMIFPNFVSAISVVTTIINQLSFTMYMTVDGVADDNFKVTPLGAMLLWLSLPLYILHISWFILWVSFKRIDVGYDFGKFRCISAICIVLFVPSTAMLVFRVAATIMSSSSPGNDRLCATIAVCLYSVISSTVYAFLGAFLILGIFEGGNYRNRPVIRVELADLEFDGHHHHLYPNRILRHNHHRNVDFATMEMVALPHEDGEGDVDDEPPNCQSDACAASSCHVPHVDGDDDDESVAVRTDSSPLRSVSSVSSLSSISTLSV